MVGDNKKRTNETEVSHWFFLGFNRVNYIK